MTSHNTPRRNFITTIIGSAAAFGLSSAIAPLKAVAENSTPKSNEDAEKWFAQIEGKKHKMVFDMTKHNHGASIKWALTLMDTYNDMGVADNEISVVLVLRYAGFGFAFGDPLWEKYEFGKRLDLKDPETEKMTLRNLYATCKKEDDNCIELFQKRGGMVCVCEKSIEGGAESLSELLKIKKEDLQKEFINNLIPGIKIVPSGIWALNRVQELGCTFCFGG